MSDEEDLNAERTRMMEIWHEYGKTYNVFVPAEQPDPHDWNRQCFSRMKREALILRR